MSTSAFMRHLQRVRINIDQNLGRAERSEVLNEDEQNLERRVELLKTVCQNFHKKLVTLLRSQGQSTDVEKRLKKLPESCLSHTLIESSVQFGQDTGSGQVFHMSGDAEGALATIVVGMEIDIDQKIITPVRDMIEVDYPGIQKLKKQLNSRILDMDSAKARYASALKQSQAGVQTKLDEARLEVEDANAKVEQMKDLLATEMYNFVSKESELNRCLLELAQIQIVYHRQSLGILERLIPQIQESIEFSIKKPLFGQLLHEHLDSENREIAYVLEECIALLNEFGLEEEGLFRLAGSTSKIKKLKAAFNSSQRPVISSEEDLDLHVIASVLKLYLRELPDPLMCSDLCSEWLQALQRPADQRLPYLRDVMNKMSKPYRQNLRYLIKFLAKLSEYADVNKMSASNIALVMAPNLLWAAGETGPNMLTTGLQSSIVELLVANATYFFPGSIDFTLVRPSGTQVVSPDANTSSGASSQHVALGNITANILSGFVTQENTQDSSVSSASPGTMKRGPKKPPAPLPPPDKPVDSGQMHPAVLKSLSCGSQSGGNSNTTTRLSIPETAITGDSAIIPKLVRPSSPRLERPKVSPPERPQIPPPEKPAAVDKPAVSRDKPTTRTAPHQSNSVFEKPVLMNKPSLGSDSSSPSTETTMIKLYPSLHDVVEKEPKVEATPAYQAHVRQSSYGGGGNKPPRPQPPPPSQIRP